jgi:hypothetical protein
MNPIENKRVLGPWLKDKLYLGLIVLVSVVITLSRIQFSQAEDMGIFLTVSALVANGYKLYEEVIDIKDPLFFYTTAITIKLFGLKSAFLLDVFWVTGSTLIAFWLLKKFGFAQYVSFFSSIAFLLTLTGASYGSLRTQLPGIFFLLVGLIFFLKNNFFISGIFLGIMCMFKLPFFLFLLIPIVLIIFDSRKPKEKFLSLRNGAAGFFLAINTVILVLISRGEFSGYQEMLRENFHYASVYQSVVGQKSGIIGHIQVWNSDGMRFFASLILILYLISMFLQKKQLRNSRFIIFSLVLVLCTALYLINTALWAHHLQILSLISLIAIPALIYSPKEPLLKHNLLLEKFKPKGRLTLNQKIFRTSAFFLVIGLLLTNGLTISRVNLSHLKSYEFNDSPPEIKILKQFSEYGFADFDFARLGTNDDMGFGAFIKDNWKFKCKRTIIAGGETLEQIEDFLSCIRNVPDLLIISPGFEAQSNRKGVYERYYEEANNITQRLFNCFPYRDTSFNFCVRKDDYRIKNGFGF